MSNIDGSSIPYKSPLCKYLDLFFVNFLKDGKGRDIKWEGVQYRAWNLQKEGKEGQDKKGRKFHNTGF